MSNQEILEKAIQKAIDGGWSPGWLDRRPVVSWGVQYATDYDDGEGVMVFGYHAKSNASTWFFPLKELIFNHDFAKALWGDGTNNIKVNDDGTLSPIDPTKPTKFTTLLDYKDHLQQMVIAEDPIKYLGENL